MYEEEKDMSNSPNVHEWMLPQVPAHAGRVVDEGHAARGEVGCGADA